MEQERSVTSDNQGRETVIEGQGSVALLVYMCHFEVSEAQPRPSVSLFLLPENQNVKLSDCSPAPGMPASCHTPHHDDNGLNLQGCKPQLSALFL